jgi:hypothetical protein
MIAIAAFAEDFINMVFINMLPHILKRQSRPLLSSELRQEAWEIALHGVTAHPVHEKLVQNYKKTI